MSLFKSLSMLAIVAITSPVLAGEVYVCEKNGHKEFSQLPCGDNAVVLKTKGDAANIKISMPMKAKEITALCKLVITAKDKMAQSQKTYSRSNRYGRYDYNYNNRNSSTNNPQAYVLAHIANLEQIATSSPNLYELIKGMTDNVYYQGYEESPIYEAERAAALSNCEDNTNRRISYLDQN